MTTDPSTFPLVMQTRCPHCLSEQYGLNVMPFSRGETGCTRCGLLSEPLSTKQWCQALADTRRRLRP